MTPTQLIADVGGMAGFMLGMSVATVVAFIDSGIDQFWQSIFWIRNKE